MLVFGFSVNFIVVMEFVEMNYVRVFESFVSLDFFLFVFFRIFYSFIEGIRIKFNYKGV